MSWCAPTRNVLREFYSTTQINGINNASRATHPLRKIIWWVVTVVAAGATVQGICGVITAYLQYSVSTTSSVTQPKSLTFPAVTVCNLSPFPCSKFTQQGDVAELAKVDGGGGKEVARDQTTGNSYYYVLSRLSEEQKLPLLQDRDDFIRGCKYEGVDCKRFFFPFANTSYGSCYAFNMKLNEDRDSEAGSRRTVLPGPYSGYNIDNPTYRPLTTEINGLGECALLKRINCISQVLLFENNTSVIENAGRYRPTTKSSRRSLSSPIGKRNAPVSLRSGRSPLTIAHPSAGLELELYVNAREWPSSVLSSEGGVRVIVHQTDNLPSPEESGFDARTGTATKVEVSRMAHPYESDCYSSWDECGYHPVNSTFVTYDSLSTSLLSNLGGALSLYLGISMVMFLEIIEILPLIALAFVNRCFGIGHAPTANPPPRKRASRRIARLEYPISSAWVVKPD
ncbi:unnamed protein product [Darwinula stevensoni]|uniref:Uncharacterized protein n=1 Tax=Darwinula stevensoni TaxID=69355 RepID=A0A7R8XI50_9CRUS|nr:unnamed protein product [Darwinula stevensoni]CAG0894005.1 unnamed protein product [Darwinula stevensoni]